MQRGSLKARIGSVLIAVLMVTALLGAAPTLAAGELTCANLPTTGRVSASADLAYQVRVVWEPVQGADKFWLFRDGAWYKELTAADTAFLNTLLLPGVTYEYEVFALCSTTPRSLGKATATPSGDQIAPIARSSYSFYIAEGDSVVGGAYILPGPNEALARRYTRQVTDFLLGDGATERNEYAGGSKCRDYSNGGSRYGLTERLGDKMTNANWAQADLVTIGVGLHELRAGGVSADTYRECMRQVVQMISPTPERQLIRTLVLVGIAPDVSGESLTNGWLTYIRSWNRALKEVAFHSRVPFADVESKLGQAEQEALSAGECVPRNSIDPEVVPTCTSLFMFDQVHPSWRGHDLITDAVIDALLPSMPDTFAAKAFPSRPMPQDHRIVAAPSEGTVRFSWSPPSAPYAGQLRPTDTYEVRYKLADASDWTSVMTSQTYADLPIPPVSPKHLWVAVRAYGLGGVPGPWSTYGHEARLAPTEWFERSPHYREQDFLRDRSDMAVAWDPRDLPNANPDLNCDDGCAYIFGGRASQGDQISTEVFRFNPKTNRLTFVAHLKVGSALKKFWGGSAVFDGKKIYLFGGYQDTGLSDVILSFDPVTAVTKDTGVRLPSESGSAARAYTSAVFDPRSSAACPEGCAYIFGGTKKTTSGTSSSYFYFSQIIRFDPKGSTASAMPGARLMGRASKTGRCCTSAVWDNQGQRAIIFGGRVADATSDYVITNDVLAFDPVADTVATISSLPAPLQFTMSAWDGSNAYVFGGDFDGAVYTSDRIMRMAPDGTFTVLGQRLSSSRRLGGAMCDGKAAYIFGGDWINGYFIQHPYQIPPTNIRFATTQTLKFPSIAQSAEGCDPAGKAYPPVITSPASGALTGNGAIQIKGRAEPGDVVTILEAGGQLAQTAANAAGVWSVGVTLPSGPHSISARATDGLGRTSFESDLLSFNVDNTPPNPPVLTSPVDGGTVQTRSVVFVGSAEPASTVKVYRGTALLVTATAASDGTFAAGAYLALGSHSVHLVAVDRLGNTSLDSPVTTFQVSAPTAQTVGAIESARWGSGVAFDPQDRSGCPGGCVYMFGGLGPAGSSALGGRMDHIYRYNPSSGSGSRLAAKLPSPSAGIAAVFDGTGIWLFGGQPTDMSSSDKIYRFDPANGSLTESSVKLPVHGGTSTLRGRSFASAVWDPRDRPTAGCPGGCAYIFGGVHKEGINDRYLNQIVKFNPTLGVAVPMAATLPGTSAMSGRSSMAAAWDPVRQVAVLVGGQVSTTTFSDQIIIFDPVTGSVTVSAAKLPRARQLPAAAYHPSTQTILVAGGYSGSSVYPDEIMRFDVGANSLNVAGYMAPGLKGMGAVTVDDKMLMLGGFNATSSAAVLRFP